MDQEIDSIQRLILQMAHCGAIWEEVMPLAMRNLEIAQQRDKERFEVVTRRGGELAKGYIFCWRFRNVGATSERHSLYADPPPHA